LCDDGASPRHAEHSPVTTLSPRPVLKSRFSWPPQMKTPPLSQVEQIPETLPRRQALERPDSATDVLIVGAGPTGMACAIETQKAGFKALIVDKGCLVNSIFHYPNNMVFFTTPELLEIGDSLSPPLCRSLHAWKRSNITAAWPSTMTWISASTNG
jgi:hypothetical protein